MPKNSKPARKTPTAIRPSDTLTDKERRRLKESAPDMNEDDLMAGMDAVMLENPDLFI